MKIAIIASKKDPAGMNIAEELEKLGIKPYLMEQDSINCEDIDKEIDADAFIFATKHQSKEGKASLTVHCPGNWGKAELGGKDRQICVSMPKFMRKAYLLLKEKDTEHLVTIEVTHHGPYLEKPCMFIEIGSCENDWKNKELGKIIASVIKELLDYTADDCEVVFGIGGNHYCATIGKLLDKNIAVGHVCPKYALAELDSKMIEQAISKNMDKLDYIVVDWKGLGKEKERIIKLLDEKKIIWKRSDKI